MRQCRSTRSLSTLSSSPMASPSASSSSPRQPGEATDCQGISSPESPSSVVSVLLCGGCQRAIAREDDILHTRDPTAWKDHVYSYEIDLFEDGRPIWAYSATNPSARRFDVVRVAIHTTANTPAPSPPLHGVSYAKEAAGEGSDLEKKCVMDDSALAAPLIYFTGPYSSEHSFFMGFAWCFAHCATCGHFLGWGFAPEEACAGTATTAASADPTNSSAPEGQAREVDSEASGADTSADDETEECEEVPLTLVPQFVGIIVTQCTGECEYPANRYHDDLRNAHHRRRVRAAVEAFRRALIRDLHALPSLATAQTIFLYYRQLEMKLFTTGSVEGVQDVLIDWRPRSQRRRMEDDVADASSRPAPTLPSGYPAFIASLLPRPFHELAESVRHLLRGGGSESESDDDDETPQSGEEQAGENQA